VAPPHGSPELARPVQEGQRRVACKTAITGSNPVVASLSDEFKTAGFRRPTHPGGHGVHPF